MDTKVSIENHPPLLVKLIGKQRQENLSDYKYARKLGIKRPLWRMTRLGKRALGITVLKATVKTYPELNADVLDFLRSEDHDKETTE